MSRYVYRSPAEPEPRETTSGRQNVITLGAVPSVQNMRLCPAWGCNGPEPITRVNLPVLPVSPLPPKPRFPSLPLLPSSSGYVYVGSGPFAGQACDPMSDIALMGVSCEASSGATSTVAQPPPSAGGTLAVPNPAPVPISPAPSPTVAVPTSQTAPSLPNPGVSGWLANTAYQIGQTLVDANGHVQAVTAAGTSGSAVPNFSDVGGTTADGSVVWTDQGAGGAASSLTSWFSGSTAIGGINIPNWGFIAVAVGAFFLMKGKR